MEGASLHRPLTRPKIGEINIDKLKLNPIEEMDDGPASKPLKTVDRTSADGARRDGNAAATGRPGDIQKCARGGIGKAGDGDQMNGKQTRPDGTGRKVTRDGGNHHLQA